MSNENILKLNESLPDKNQSQKTIKTIPEIINDANSINDQIKLRAKKLSSGSYSLYLDLRQDGVKEYQFLKIYVRDVKTDRELIRKAILIRDKKQDKLFENEHNFRLHNDGLKIDFVKYFERLALNRQRPDKSWRHSLKHLRIYTKERPVPFKYIDEKFCEGFKDYLLKNLNENTSHVYFAKLKAALNRAIRDKIITQNPATSFHISKREVKREFLNSSQIKRLKNTPCKNENAKNAFLFACYCGLRISDLKRLTWNDINDGYLYFRQKKTQDINRIKLHKTATQTLERQKQLTHDSEYVFKLGHDSNTGNALKEWAKDAGLDINLTWHTARHSFATNLISAGVSLYSVQKLLGHRTIKVTELYAKLLDEQKDQAVDSLPEL